MLVVIMGMLIFSGLAYVSERNEENTGFISMPQVGWTQNSYIIFLKPRPFMCFMVFPSYQLSGFPDKLLTFYTSFDFHSTNKTTGLQFQLVCCSVIGWKKSNFFNTEMRPNYKKLFFLSALELFCCLPPTPPPFCCLPPLFCCLKVSRSRNKNYWAITSNIKTNKRICFSILTTRKYLKLEFRFQVSSISLLSG